MSDDAPIDVPKALQNVMQMLQGQPRRYRLFGIWWWPVKALLKRSGYTRDNLYLLGDYQDQDTAAMVPRDDLQGTLRAAFTEYGHNARYPHPDGKVENQDGELVTIYDEDVGF